MRAQGENEMDVAFHRFRWVATVVCMVTLGLPAVQAQGDPPGESLANYQSPTPTVPPAPTVPPTPNMPPPAVADATMPLNEGLWTAASDGGIDLTDSIWRYHTDTVWFRADYLLWWTSGAQLPPLVTTSPQGIALADAGVLGKDTTVLFGDQVVGGDVRSGFRTILGIWMDASMLWDLEFEYFSPGGRSVGFAETSSGDPILARPFLDFQTNQQSALPVAYPGVATGTITAEASDYFQSFGLSVSRCLYEYNYTDPLKPDAPLLRPCFISAYRFDFVGAFRYYGLSDRVTVGENVVFANYFGVQNVNVVGIDGFSVGNDFFGGEIGLRTRMRRGNWSLDVLGKVALGDNHRTVDIGGATAITPPGGPTIVVASGALATGSNRGVHTHDAFTAIPALNLELGYRWNCHWRAYVGYDLIYWGEVARAADQIDLAIDQSGAGRAPVFPDRTTKFLVQGFSVGAELRF